MCPPISPHKFLDTAEKVLDFIPSLRILQMALQLIVGEVNWTIPFQAQFFPIPKSGVRYH
jgi:hypothetical protein